MSKSKNPLSITRRRLAVARVHHSYARAVAALRVAEDACHELASVVSGLRPDEAAASGIDARTQLEATSVAWCVEIQTSVLDGNAPWEVGEILRAGSDADANAEAMERMRQAEAAAERAAS